MITLKVQSQDLSKKTIQMHSCRWKKFPRDLHNLSDHLFCCHEIYAHLFYILKRSFINFSAILFPSQLFSSEVIFTNLVLDI